MATKHVGPLFPDEGSNQHTLHWKAKSLPLDPPGMSLSFFSLSFQSQILFGYPNVTESLYPEVYTDRTALTGQVNAPSVCKISTFTPVTHLRICYYSLECFVIRIGFKYAFLKGR